jgi:flagellar basal body L-ring protein FlgH
MRIITGVLLSLMIGMGAALAQTPAPAPAPSPAPAAQPAAPAMTADQKKAISKSCSDQATAKGLHGKARKKFRAECKKNGGTAPAQ